MSCFKFRGQQISKSLLAQLVIFIVYHIFFTLLQISKCPLVLHPTLNVREIGMSWKLKQLKKNVF